MIGKLQFKNHKNTVTLVCEKTCSSLSIKKVAQKMNESSVVFISFSVGGKAARSLRLKKHYILISLKFVEL